MGGFLDPFVPAPAWPQGIEFTGTSWSARSSFPCDAGTYLGPAPAEDMEYFHLQNGSSQGILNADAKETVSPVELHEQFLQAQLQGDVMQGLNFEADSAMKRALMACALGSVVCSSDDSSESEQSSLHQFLLGEQHAPAFAEWPSAFARISSFIGKETSQSFSSGDLLHGACTPDGKKYPQLGNVPPTPLQLQDDAELNAGKMLSFTPGQQVNTNFDALRISEKELEFSGLHHLNLSKLVSGQLSSFNATGGAHNPKQSNGVSSGKNGLNVPPFTAKAEVANDNGVAGTGAPKPRVRARRGEATDPHSIAERLRRERISDRMKDLQELVPNSNRADKASMLDEIIDYVRFLQLQVKVLSMSRLGATEAVVPLLTDSKAELVQVMHSSGGFLPSQRSGGKAGGGSMLGESELWGGSLLVESELRDGSAFEQEVVRLMEKNMTTAMQYLQSKGLCLMPIALASAISDQVGTSSAAVEPKNGGAASEKDVMRAAKPFGGPVEMRSRA